MGTGRHGLLMVGSLAVLLVLGLWASTALAATINVPADYASIQAAIDAADDGDEVVVAPDTYYERINFKGKAITVRSTDPDDPAVVQATIIDGQENGSVVTFRNGEGPASVLRGFTVRNGNRRRGGGVRCSEASPTIMGNAITGNSARGREGSGGGIYSTRGSPAITGNMISGNSGRWGAGIHCLESSATIAGNTIAGNSGGGIHCHRGGPTITGNTITGNSGTGVVCGDCKATVRGNTISDNLCGVGCGGGSPTITENVISGNSGSRGAGVSCYFGSPTITGNTIRGNSARYQGGGIRCLFSSATIAANAVNGNSALYGGGIHCFRSSPTIAGNTISANSATRDGGGILCQAGKPLITSNALSGNSAKHGGGIYCSHSSPMIADTIVAFSESGGGIRAGALSSTVVAYCDVYGNTGGDYVGFTPSGSGNISEDPLFADAAAGDFHLKSTGGRWDPVSESWVYDAEHSPCIDRGDPSADYSKEPPLNGHRINIGAYGNTAEASKSRFHLPQLSWLGTTGYEADGVDPDQGTRGDTRFRFKVLYSDADGHAPRFVRMHLRRNGKPFGEFAMVRGVGDYEQGRVYRRGVKLPPGHYEHRFKARDKDGLATGEATKWTPGPVVVRRTAVALTSLCAVPTSAGTQITFSLSSAAQVQARVLNIAGRPVKTLCHAKTCGAGSNTLLWNAQSDSGLPVPNGAYLVEIMAKGADGAQARALGQVRVSR